MRHFFVCCLAFTLLYSCKKEHAAGIEIYMLTSFTATNGMSTTPNLYTLSISNAVLADTPLVADQNIAFYEKSTATFHLKKDISPIIKNYGPDKAFAVTVNKEPAYFGKFHPAYLSSLTIGVATIDPLFNLNKELEIRFVMINGNADLQKLDKRNDSRIINSLKVTGRLR